VQNKKHGKYHLPVHESVSSNSKKKASASNVQGSVKAVHVTACGNFGLAANTQGVIGMWNMQSGIRRKTFKLPIPSSGKTPLTNGIQAENIVVGLTADTLNRVVIAATQDGTINVGGSRLCSF
jgi:U3 small nucleolar RNA-associated protein 21